MNEINKTNLTGQIKFSLNEISKIQNYFNQETSHRKSCSKKLIKHITAFDYIKILIVLSATSRVCIISSVSIVGAPIRKAGASFTLSFSLTTGIIKTLLSNTGNKR